MREQLKWYGEKADNSPWIRALAELRQRAAREGYCYQHVQAITVAIDQYAEKALGNRHYFLNKPYGVGLTTRRLASYAKRRVRRASARLPMSSAASRMTVRQRTSTILSSICAHYLLRLMTCAISPRKISEPDPTVKRYQ
jgi:hypothetical protein